MWVQDGFRVWVREGLRGVGAEVVHGCRCGRGLGRVQGCGCRSLNPPPKPTPLKTPPHPPESSSYTNPPKSSSCAHPLPAPVPIYYCTHTPERSSPIPHELQLIPLNRGFWDIFPEFVQMYLRATEGRNKQHMLGYHPPPPPPHTHTQWQLTQ